MNSFFIFLFIAVLPSISSLLYQRRFETAPLRGAIVQTVTGNLVKVSSAQRIEIFNGVNPNEPKICKNCKFFVKAGILSGDKFGKCLVFPYRGEQDHFLVDGIHEKK